MTSTGSRLRSPLAGTLFALLFVFLPAVAHAFSCSGTYTTADTSGLYRVTLKDGTSLIGTISGRTSDSLAVRTGSNLLITVARLDVKETEQLNGTIVDGEYHRDDPNASRLFFGPTARPVHGGYFAAYEIFFPFVSFGIADILTIAGGMTLFPGASEQLFYLAPKISVPLGADNFSLAGGLLYTNITGGKGDGVGIAYAVTTIGSRNASLTVGMGLGFAGGEFARNPILLVGGEVQISNSVALITENWIPTGSDVQLLSFGFRFFGDHLSADLGFMHPLTKSDSEGFPFLPWLGFSYNFGR